jgi:hypothetical protein
METFGRYRLTFTPSEGEICPSVEMTLSGEASLPQMLSFFDAFLKASGYVYNGELQIGDDYPSDLFQAPHLNLSGPQATDIFEFSK